MRIDFPGLTDRTEQIIIAYTELGAFRPRRVRVVPLAVRQSHVGRHHVKRSASPLRWLASKARDLGDAMVGAFLAVD